MGNSAKRPRSVGDVLRSHSAGQKGYTGLQRSSTKCTRAASHTTETRDKVKRPSHRGITRNWGSSKVKNPSSEVADIPPGHGANRSLALCRCQNRLTLPQSSSNLH